MLSQEQKTVLENLGADIATALGRLNNNESLYARLLGIFYKTNADAPAQYRAYLEAGDVDNLLRLVHDLKSGSGNLGLTALYDLAVEFERILKEQKAIDAEVAQKLLEEFEKTLTHLSSVL